MGTFNEVLLCCCSFMNSIYYRKCLESLTTLQKTPSLPNLDLIISNKSRFPSLFSQEKLLWYSHEIDAIATLHIISVLDFNSAQNCTMRLLFLCKSSHWSPEMSALLLLLKSTSKGKKVAKWFSLENYCCSQNWFMA